MNRKLLLTLATAIGITAAATTVMAAPLPAGTKLTIEKTTDGPLVQAAPCTNGSCFGMFLFAGLYAWTPLGPGSDGGIVIGKGQTSGGQETNGLSANSGQLTEVWVYGGNNGTFFTAPSDAGNVFDDASCSGSACGSNTVPYKTALKVWNTAWGGQTIPMGSAGGCNPAMTPACTADEIAGIFVKSWTIDPSGTVPRKYRLTYNQVVPVVFPNYPFELVLAGNIENGNPSPTVTVTPANVLVYYGVPSTFTITVTDPDGGPVPAPTCRVGTRPANGIVTLNDCTSGTYTADIGFIGIDSFTIIANDGLVDSAPFTVNVYTEFPPASPTPTPTSTPIYTASPTPTLPVYMPSPTPTFSEPPLPIVIASDLSLTANAGATVSWKPSVQVLNGNGFVFSNCSVSAPLHGSATLTSDCRTGTYTAPINYTGSDSFSYYAAGCVPSAPAQYCAGAGAMVTVNVVGSGVTPTPTPVSNVCTDRYPVSASSQTGKDGTLTISFTGNIVSTTNKAVKVCPGTVLKYQASSTKGPVVCKVKNSTTRGSGSLRINDHIKCTDKPAGHDQLGIKIKSGVSQK